MVNLLLIWIGFVVRLANALGDDLWKALSVAQVLAIGTLHTRRILQKFTAKGTAHNVIELLRNEFVTLLFSNNVSLLTYSALAIKPSVIHAALVGVFNCAA